MPASLDDINKETIKNTNTLNAINKSIKDQTKLLTKPEKKDVEGEREKKDANRKFLDELKGIIGAAVGGAGKAGKGAGKMLAKFLKFGLTAIMLPFMGLIGAIAGVFSGIMATPEVKFLGGIIKTIGKTAVGFVKFMGSIAKWMLNLIPGGKWGTKIFGVFGKIGETMTGMLGRWGDKLAGIFKHPKIAAVMGKVSKFIRPLARIAIWLFSAYEFIKGWGKADQIFGKEEGGATIVEKFASGIGGVIDFLSFGLIEIEVAAVALKKTFDFFKLAVTKPGEAWKIITTWWEDFSFDETIVQPMLKMFDNFPKMVRTFIDGPLSNFGSMAVTMLKDFVFGKKDPNAEEGDAESGGLWGGIKSLFSAKNIAKAIKGFVKITAGFYKMLGSLVSIPLIGTKGDWTDLESWGGIFGWIKDDLFNWENIKGAVITYFTIWGKIAMWLKNIFWHDDGESGLLQMFFGWIQTKFKDIKFPDIDFSTAIKDMLRPIIKMKGMSLILPDSLYDWVGEKKVKTVAEKLAETHPGKMTKDEFMADKKHGKVLDPKTGEMKSSSKAQERAYQAYLKGEGGIPGLPPGKVIGPKKSTGIDWGFISSKEGGSKLDGYVPNPEGSKSGVTVATGFDLGARGMNDLKGLSPELQAKLKPFLGLQGQSAVAALGQAGGLKITAAEAKEIDKMSKGGAVSKLKSEWNARAKKMGGALFDDLSSGQKTIAASVAFQYGSLSKAPKFRDAIQSGDWEGAAGELDNFGDSYGTRRASEAAYLRNDTGIRLAQAQANSSKFKTGGQSGSSNTNSSTTINQGTQIAMNPPLHDTHREPITASG